MESTRVAQFTTSRGYKYSYVHLPSSSNHPYILFLHGFPSHSYDWRHQIEYFSQRGFGIIAPDLLGYGESSKPLDVNAYRLRAISEDIWELLESQKISKVVGVGHDWGSTLLSRFANYSPGLFSKLVFIEVGYSKPGGSLSIAGIKHIDSLVQQKLGYGVLGYFIFFGDKDAAQLMNENSDSVQSIFYSTDESLGKRYLGAEGGLREWLSDGKIAPAVSYFTDQDKAEYLKAFSAGYEAPINWYRAQLEHVNKLDENAIPEDNHILTQPTLLITGTNFITKSAQFEESMKPLVPNLTIEETDAGHWIMIEKADIVNAMMDKFLRT